MSESKKRRILLNNEITKLSNIVRNLTSNEIGLTKNEDSVSVDKNNSKSVTETLKYACCLINSKIILRNPVYTGTTKYQEKPDCFYDLTDRIANGFVLVFNQKGLCVNISSNSLNLIGYPTFSLIGKNILDIIHPDDCKTLSNCINDGSIPQIFTFLNSSENTIKITGSFKMMNKNVKKNDDNQVATKNFIRKYKHILRFKCFQGENTIIPTIDKKKTSNLHLNRNISSNSFIYKNFVCNFSMRLDPFNCSKFSNYCTIFAQPALNFSSNSTNQSLVLNNDIFYSIHHLDMTLIFLSSMEFLNATEYKMKKNSHEKLYLKSWYDLCHTEDLNKVSIFHKQLIESGISSSEVYRVSNYFFIGDNKQSHHGNYSYISSKGCLIYDNELKPTHFYLVHSYISSKPTSHLISPPNISIDYIMDQILNDKQCSDNSKQLNNLSIDYEISQMFPTNVPLMFPSHLSDRSPFISFQDDDVCLFNLNNGLFDNVNIEQIIHNQPSPSMTAALDVKSDYELNRNANIIRHKAMIDLFNNLLQVKHS